MNATAIIAEDEVPLGEQLSEMLATAWPELRIVAFAEDGVKAMRAFETHRPDFAFLDIHLPEMSGLDIATRIAGRGHVVFVTAFDDYAVAAFDQGAVDYLLKPLSDERVAIAVQRLKARLSSTPANLAGLAAGALPPGPGGRPFLRWINASSGDGLRLITIEEVRYFQSDLKYTRVVAGRHEGLIRKSLKELLEELDPETFWQVHRGTIVNLHAVERVTRDFKGHVSLHIRDRPESLAVSQQFAHRFRRM